MEHHEHLGEVRTVGQVGVAWPLTPITGGVVTVPSMLESDCGARRRRRAGHSFVICDPATTRFVDFERVSSSSWRKPPDQRCR